MFVAVDLTLVVAILNDFVDALSKLFARGSLVLERCLHSSNHQVEFLRLAFAHQITSRFLCSESLLQLLTLIIEEHELLLVGLLVLSDLVVQLADAGVNVFFVVLQIHARLCL